MPKVCHVCTSPQRAEIELSVANGTTYRKIAERYGTSPPALTRHMREHVKQAAKHLVAAREEAKTLDVLAQLMDINAATLAIFNAAKDNPKKHGLALAAVDRLMRQLELAAKLQGDLAVEPTLLVSLPAPWELIELAIAQALSPYPDAAVAVADALARVEAGNAGLN